MKLTLVKGIPVSLWPNFVQYKCLHSQENVLSFKRWNSDLNRYLETFEEISSYTWAGVLRTIGEFNYERTSKVAEVGQFAVQGDTLSIWSPGLTDPIRMSFFGDQLESIESYDYLSGRGLRKYKNFWLGDLDELTDRTDRENISWADGYEKFADTAYALVSLEESDRSVLAYDLTQPQLYFSRFDLLATDLAKYATAGYDIQIVTKHNKDIPKNIKEYTNRRINKDLPLAEWEDAESGFMSEELKVLVLSDRELFGTIFLSQRNKQIKSSEARKLLLQLEGEIEVGDYIVHEDYGVGIYGGLVLEEGSDYLKVSYAAQDELFVPVDQIGKLTKYIGDEGQKIVLTRLGKSDWELIRKRVKASVAIAAEELAKHYAKTQVAKAKSIDPLDSESYKNFLDKFPYAPTPDQLKAEREIIGDLTKPKPMNRLLIGDVGYGKTEVLLRAAFKILEAGSQVVILCPTTVLALQHYHNVKARFSETEVRIGLLSRYNSPSKNSAIVKKFAQGELDLIIGTHRILSTDFAPKNLGLLVIDEEQRFGVKQKEQIRKLEYGVHTLYVSATPIPRTLSMALSSIQDISLIQTPPPGRIPVKTFVEKMNWPQIVEAIRTEKKRSGQVFFVHNRIETIQSLLAKLNTLLPDISFVVAHGKLPAEKIDEIMTEFYEGKFDCLISTTIIENGVDIPNVNTLIVDLAENLGLSQMYQLRGRVGRSSNQAYAYFFYKGKNILALEEVIEVDDSEEVTEQIKPKYIERLETILNAQELGSGFKVASRDLEIRGAGNLLGGEQHGNIQKVGYGLYMQMLAFEVERLTTVAETKTGSL